jgi:hypothetical protein
MTRTITIPDELLYSPRPGFDKWERLALLEKQSVGVLRALYEERYGSKPERGDTKRVLADSILGAEVSAAEVQG